MGGVRTTNNSISRGENNPITQYKKGFLLKKRAKIPQNWLKRINPPKFLKPTKLILLRKETGSGTPAPGKDRQPSRTCREPSRTKHSWLPQSPPDWGPLEAQSGKERRSSSSPPPSVISRQPAPQPPPYSQETRQTRQLPGWGHS